jgi:hypothetical protein
LLRLLSHVQHVCRRHPVVVVQLMLAQLARHYAPQHFNDSRDLIILARTRKQWQAQEEFYSDATQ